MNHALAITPAQLRRLQTLYAQYDRRTIGDVGDERSRRLEWASSALRRAVSSFSDLATDEAAKLIDLLQSSLGVKPTRRRRRIRTRDRAQAAGTEGRRGNTTNTLTLASAEDLARIQDAVTRLGWDQSRLEAFLRSKASPLGRQSSQQIRTTRDANKVWWALKKLLKREGLWRKS
ncbi:MAG TPA: hypothetical protein VN622_08950 [Clostridia bacterium]|nr:hypothetical protein [Clostridia bacterium]